jgi:hypothetical protein
MPFLARFTAALILAMAALAALAAVAYGQQHECTLSVEPPVGQIGTEFQLTGEGYRPLSVVLQKDGADPVTIELDLPDDGAFAIPIASGPGDEGRWTATASDPAAGCEAAVTFRVTLLDTATGDVLPGATAALPLVGYLLVMLAGVIGGAVLARLRRRT